jgi:hypothetical protein
MNNKTFKIAEKGIFMDLTVNNIQELPEMLITHLKGFALDFTQENDIVELSFFSDTENDRNILKEFLDKLAQNGFTQEN